MANRATRRRKKQRPTADWRQGRMLYFAYGSNMHTEQMRWRASTARPLGKAWLQGWRLVFRGVADIVADPKAKTGGVLWSITPADLRALDNYEGYPRLYTRFTVTVEFEGQGPAQAWVYVMVHDNDYRGLPSKPYLRTCLEGYSAWGLPHWHLQRALRDASRTLIDAGLGKADLVRDGKRYRTKAEMAAIKAERRELRTARRRVDVPAWVPTHEGLVSVDTLMSMSPATRAELGLEMAYQQALDRTESAGRARHARMREHYDDDLPELSWAGAIDDVLDSIDRDGNLKGESL